MLTCLSFQSVTFIRENPDMYIKFMKVAKPTKMRYAVTKNSLIKNYYGVRIKLMLMMIVKNE